MRVTGPGGTRGLNAVGVRPGEGEQEDSQEAVRHLLEDAGRNEPGHTLRLIDRAYLASPTTLPSKSQLGSILMPRCARAVTATSTMAGVLPSRPTTAEGPLAR